MVEFPKDAVNEIERDIPMDVDASATTTLALALTEELYVKETVPETWAEKVDVAGFDVPL